MTVMASLLRTTTTTLQHNHTICFFPLKPTTPNNISFLTNRFKSNTNTARCNAFFDNIPKDLLDNTFYMDQFPVFRSGLVKFQSVTEDFSDMQRWGFLIFAGLTWIYFTTRPGVLVGAIDAYLLAPLRLVLDSLSGRRNLKRTDFLIGDKLGEGSFGVVYSGVLVPKNVHVEERMQKSGRGKIRKLDAKSKDKVILKKVKVGIQGAEEFGDFEEWFNYRLSRAAPGTCAKFLGSFIADENNSQFTKGGKWLVWKFELNSPDLFDMYSAGIVLLQMAIPTLRTSTALKNFNLEIKTCGYDLNKWRDSTRIRSDFQILDSDSGRG